MTDERDKPGPGSLEAPFLFVPHGAPEPTEWMRRHPGWVRFPATFVPHAPAAQRMIPSTNRPWPVDKRGQPWPRSRFGQPLRPLDEYPPGVRAPGEGYTGPIADPARAVQGYRAFMAAGGLDTYDPDPDAPAKAYLRSRGVLGSPGQDVGDPPPAAAPLRAERTADAILAGMDRASAAGTGGGVQAAQVALPVPGLPSPTAMATGAAPAAVERDLPGAVARAGGRLGHVAGEVARGDLSGAAGHLLGGKPYPEAVDDPALAAMRAGQPGFAPAPAGLLGRPGEGGFTPAATMPEAEPGSIIDGVLQGPTIVAAKAESPLKSYADDPRRLEGRASSDVEAEMDRVLVRGAGWSKVPSRDGNGIAYRDGKGGLLIINDGYETGATEGQGDLTHQGPYVKLSTSGQTTRIPLLDNPALTTRGEK